MRLLGYRRYSFKIGKHAYAGPVAILSFADSNSRITIGRLHLLSLKRVDEFISQHSGRDNA